MPADELRRRHLQECRHPRGTHSGRATTPSTREGWRGEYLDGLWVEGFIDADDMAEFEVRNFPISTTEVRTYWLWRGTRHPDGSLSLRAPEPSCGRSVVLARN